MAKAPVSKSNRPPKQQKDKTSTTQAKAKQPASQEYDSPWKEIIEIFFPQFMAFFFPTIATAIDWTKPVEFLDKEFQRTIRRSEVGRQTVDKLVKVWLLSGEEVWVLIHIEVQSQKESAFTTRMYIYRYRIFDRYRRPILSLAIIGDDDPEWRPDRYETELLGNKESLQFGMIKLLDYEAKWSELEQNSNPFAVVVMAHLKALVTQNKEQDRLFWKKNLIKELYKRSYEKQEIFNLFRFLDWVMKLPDALEAQIQMMIEEYEEANQMQYVTSIERMALDRGKKEGLKEGKREGKKEGIKEGQQEGRNLALRETVIELLDHRFQLTEEEKMLLAKLLGSIRDELHLKQTINLTMDVEGFADFAAKLQALIPKAIAEVPILSSQESSSKPNA